MDSAHEIVLSHGPLRRGRGDRVLHGTEHSETRDRGGMHAWQSVGRFEQRAAQLGVALHHGACELQRQVGRDHMCGVEAEVLVAQVPQ